MTRNDVLRLTVDVIGACNNRCTFCYSKAKPDQRIALARFKEIIERHPNLQRVEIGGGEPFLHSEICEMARLCLAKGKRTDISTNGLVFHEALPMLDREFPGLLSVQINLPAGEAAAYDAVTRTTGHFPVLLQHVPRFASLSSVRARMVLFKENLGQIESIARLIRNFDIPLQVELFIPIGDATAGIIGEQELRAAYNRIFSLRMIKHNIQMTGVMHGDSTGCPAIANAYGLELEGNSCNAKTGRRTYINPAGEEKGCEFLAD